MLSTPRLILMVRFYILFVDEEWTIIYPFSIFYIIMDSFISTASEHVFLLITLGNDD